MSQKELAEEFRVVASTIALWEGATRTLPGPALRLIELFEEELGMADDSESTPEPDGGELRTSRWSRGLALSRTLVGSAADLAGSALSATLTDDERAGQLRRATQAAVARRMVTTFGELKGVSMKVGQMLSYLDFAMPPEARQALASLQTHSPPMSNERVLEVFLEEHGHAPQDLFARWDSTPIAAASIGQVHRARTHDGVEVAVKVQYPGIRAALASDLQNVALIDRLLSTLFPNQDSGVISAEVGARLLEECDYEQEAAHQRRFAELWEHHPEVLVPRVHPSLSTSRILVSDFVEGLSFSDFLAQASQPERNRAGEVLFDVAFESILKHGLFNADPHPGNYLFQDGKVVLLDFGCVKHYSPDFLDTWRGLIRATLEDDREAMVTVVERMGIARDLERYNFDYHRQMMHALYAPWLSDAPFRFDAQMVRDTWRKLIAENVNKWRMAMPGEWLFANRLQWGLYALLAMLQAESNFHRRILRLVYEPTETTPPPRQPAAVP